MKIALDKINRYFREDLEDYKLGYARIPKIRIQCTCSGLHISPSDYQIKFRRIIFLYSAGTRKIGSTILRTLVPAALLDLSLPKDTRVFLLENHKWSECTKGDIVIVSKFSINKLSKEIIYEMKKKGVVIVLDPLDGSLNFETMKIADYVLSSSNNQNDNLTSLGLKSFFIPHVVDPRIDLPKRKKLDREFGCGYIGDPMNIDKDIRDILSDNLIDTRGFQLSLSKGPKWINEARLLSHHYCGRSRLASNVYKPLTKGFLAARLDACIIASSSDTEYTKYLGNDYPYLLSRDSSLELIEMIEYARDTYGTSTWEKAMSSNETLRGESCIISIRYQYLKFLSEMVVK